MLNDALQIILQFRVFLTAAIVVALVLEIALALGTRTFGWQRRNVWIYGFFFGLKKSQCYWLAASWLWTLCIISSALFGVQMQICHLAMLLCLAAAKYGAWKRTLVLIRDLLNSALLFAAMLAENLLHSYLMETRFQIQIVVILCLLILFIVLYAVYFTVRDVQTLMQYRAEKKPEKTGNETETDDSDIPEGEEGLEVDETGEKNAGRRKRRSRKNPRKVKAKRKKKPDVADVAPEEPLEEVSEQAFEQVPEEFKNSRQEEIVDEKAAGSNRTE